MCKPHFLMQIYYIFFLEGHYFLDIQYVVAVVGKFVFYLRMNILYLVYKTVTSLKYFDPFSMFNLSFRPKLSTEN